MINKEEIDLLKKVEELTARLNRVFGERGTNVFMRYPLTFALLIFFGVLMVTEGLKEILKEITFFQDKPFTMMVIGLLILAITGTLYKKLGKGE